MPEHGARTVAIESSEAGEHWSELLRTVVRSEARILVQERGTTVAALVSAGDLERLARLDAEREARWQVVDEIHARNRDKDPDEVERDVAEALAEVRAEPGECRHATAGLN
jgi:prevent-host-death family protein